MKTQSSSPASSFSASAALSLFAAFAAAFLCSLPSARAEVWNLPAGGSWNAAASWNPATVPNGIGANATFNNAASVLNPAQTGNRTVTLDGPQTVGSINFNQDAANAFTNSVTTGTGGPLTFDQAGAGPATITTAGINTGNNTISVAIVFTDSVVATVDQTATTSATGSLNLTAAISGPGGFTKNGDGLATFGTAGKTYAGPTVLNGGRTRMSVTGHPTLTSSFTINSGAQLTLITNAGIFTFGSGPLNLNGSGATTGPFAIFPGAIRNDTNIATTINNAVVLQSPTLVHVEGSATGAMTFPNAVSGPGSLTLTAPNSSANQGQLILNGNNSYQGGTFVNGGTILVSASSATLGTGNVTVDNTASPSSIAKLTIQTGVLNAIADTATLTLAGGGIAGADQGYAELGNGINEVVSGLVLGGIMQGLGTYGSSGSGAIFMNDEYFAGAGIVTVIPEPATVAMLLGGLGALLSMQRVRRRS